MSVTRRGAGCGSFLCGRRAVLEAQVQAAPRRGTAPGDGGGAFHRWRWSRPVTRRARNAGIFRRSVVTCSCAFSQIAHEAAGLLKARRSARPSLGMECKLDDGVPRAAKNRGGGAMPFVMRGHSRRRRRR